MPQAFERPRVTARPLAFALLLPAFGFTECSEFDTVTVPEEDTLPPFAGTRLFRRNGEEVIRFDGARFEADAFNENFIVIPFGYDAGGLASIFMYRSATVQCGTQPKIIWSFVDELDAQDAQPGDQISNGRWLYFNFRPNQLTNNPDCTVTMFWTVEVQDAAGNETIARGSIRYAP